MLRASTGVATGEVRLVLAGDPSAHRELMVLGPVGAGVTTIEAAAAAGQVLVDGATAALLPERFVGDATGPGFLLRGLPPAPSSTRGGALGIADLVAASCPPTRGPTRGPTTDSSQLVPSRLRTHVAHGSHEPEHWSGGTLHRTRWSHGPSSWTPGR